MMMELARQRTWRRFGPRVAGFAEVEQKTIRLKPPRVALPEPHRSTVTITRDGERLTTQTPWRRGRTWFRGGSRGGTGGGINESGSRFTAESLFKRIIRTALGAGTSTRPATVAAEFLAEQISRPAFLSSDVEATCVATDDPRLKEK
jgi:hypothetical protein